LASDPRDTESPFGALEFLPWDHAWNDFHNGGDRLEKTIALMKEAGVGIVRTDFLWQEIEPEPGAWRFEKYERIVSEILRQGMKILGLLAYTPPWHRPDWRTPPDPPLYARYAQAVCRQFKDRVCHWEIWNEPDHAEYWIPQDGMTTYATLLKVAHAALKETDPTCVVHLGGLSQALPKSLRVLYEMGCKNAFDVLEVHPFINPLMSDSVGGLRYFYDTIRKVATEFGDAAKPVWFGEIGCPGMQDPGAAPNWWLGKNPTETVQAEWVRTLYGKALSWPGVSKIFWAFFRDTPAHFKTGTDYFGLVRRDFTRKPSFDVYRQMALGLHR
jgi:polysaccharide biosynthesis protein PslG